MKEEEREKTSIHPATCVSTPFHVRGPTYMVSSVERGRKDVVEQVEHSFSLGFELKGTSYLMLVQ
jgi:hypothetical protein